MLEDKIQLATITFLLQICPNQLYPPTTIFGLCHLTLMNTPFLSKCSHLPSCFPSACNAVSSPAPVKTLLLQEQNLWTTSLILGAFKCHSVLYTLSLNICYFVGVGGHAG